MFRTYIFQNPEDVVKDTLSGMETAFPGLHVDPENGVVMLSRDRKDRVGLICGSGAGCEPFGAGFVGEGMLTAFIYGDVFQTPSTETIGKVIHNVALLNRGGVLVLLLNYPEQVLNFGLAIEKARLKGINVESFVITDDCARTGETELVALERNLSLRIGLSGCSYVFKILGTMSTLGYSLLEILDQAMILNFRLATIGFSTYNCTTPGKVLKTEIYQIPEGDIVVGCSLHGGKGVRTIQSETMKVIINEIMMKAVEQSGLLEESKSSCCVLVNNLGSMTQMELYAIANEVDLFLGGLDISVIRMYAGAVMTSLNAKGALISLINCTGMPCWISFLDDCTEAFAWPGCRLSKVNPKIEYKEIIEDEGLDVPEPCPNGMHLSPTESLVFQRCLLAACDAIIEAEENINLLNAITGNGDCGTNMKRFAQSLIEQINELPTENVSKTFATCALIAESKMTGSIGSLYSIMFNGAAEKTDCWISCWEGAINNFKKITNTQLNECTLLDVLQPAFDMFLEKILRMGSSEWKAALLSAVRCAQCWCVKTSEMRPTHGRAKYIPKGKMSNMDAGAYGIYVVLKAIYSALTTEPEEELAEEINI